MREEVVSVIGIEPPEDTKVYRANWGDNPPRICPVCGSRSMERYTKNYLSWEGRSSSYSYVYCSSCYGKGFNK